MTSPLEHAIMIVQAVQIVQEFTRRWERTYGATNISAEERSKVETTRAHIVQSFCKFFEQTCPETFKHYQFRGACEQTDADYGGVAMVRDFI